MGHRYRDGAEFLFHLAPEYEGPLIEQDVSTRPVDVGEKYRLDQSMAIVEGGEMHRFIPGGVHRLVGGDHPRCQYVAPHVLCQQACAHPDAASESNLADLTMTIACGA